jgi:hypothetical protein
MHAPLRPATVMPALLIAALSATLAAGCATGPPVPVRPSVQACTQHLVGVLRHGTTEIREARLCRGLTSPQIKQAVGKAIFTVAGAGQHKAQWRRRAAILGKRLTYILDHPAPSSPGPTPRTSHAATSGKPGPAGARALPLAALATWLAAVAIGSYLLRGWLVHGGLRSSRTRRGALPPALIFGHLATAVAGLALWITYLALGTVVLAWVALGLLVPVAGLGMGVLTFGILGDPSRGADRGAGPRADRGTGQPADRAPGRPPFPVITAHGLFAVATMLLALLTALGAR